jgi:hypothetical protein
MYRLFILPFLFLLAIIWMSGNALLLMVKLLHFVMGFFVILILTITVISLEETK